MIRAMTELCKLANADRKNGRRMHALLDDIDTRLAGMNERIRLLEEVAGIWRECAASFAPFVQRPPEGGSRS